MKALQVGVDDSGTPPRQYRHGLPEVAEQTKLIADVQHEHHSDERTQYGTPAHDVVLKSGVHVELLEVVREKELSGTHLLHHNGVCVLRPPQSLGHQGLTEIRFLYQGHAKNKSADHRLDHNVRNDTNSQHERPRGAQQPVCTNEESGIPHGFPECVGPDRRGELRQGEACHGAFKGDMALGGPRYELCRLQILVALHLVVHDLPQVARNHAH
mmetsp:Transcript_52730/g.140687  ORF Transcript_52730/g.140687 Transcript_52730/m.140687 type:complete len:213 (-) Transcript_52730:754-1392(-)